MNVYIHLNYKNREENTLKLEEMYDNLEKNYSTTVILAEYAGIFVEYFELDSKNYMYIETKSENNGTEKYIITGDLEEMLEYASEKTEVSYADLEYAYNEYDY